MEDVGTVSTTAYWPAAGCTWASCGKSGPPGGKLMPYFRMKHSFLLLKVRNGSEQKIAPPPLPPTPQLHGCSNTTATSGTIISTLQSFLTLTKSPIYLLRQRGGLSSDGRARLGRCRRVCGCAGQAPGRDVLGWQARVRDGEAHLGQGRRHAPVRSGWASCTLSLLPAHTLTHHSRDIPGHGYRGQHGRPACATKRQLKRRFETGLEHSARLKGLW